MVAEIGPAESVQAAGFHDATGEGIPEGCGPGKEDIVVIKTYWRENVQKYMGDSVWLLHFGELAGYLGWQSDGVGLQTCRALVFSSLHDVL